MSPKRNTKIFGVSILYLYIATHQTTKLNCSANMPKSCKKRVSFNKVVGVYKGNNKKLKNVNATALLYDVLRKKPNPTLMRQLVHKHTQHGSIKKAIKESIKTLNDKDMSLCMSTQSCPSIGAYVFGMDSARNVSDRLNDAKTILEITNPHP